MNETEPTRTDGQQTKESRPNLPGKLRGRIRFELHTGEAVALLDGRKYDRKSGKARIHGLWDFSRRASNAALASMTGDRSADDVLVMIEGRMGTFQTLVKEERLRLLSLIGEHLDIFMSGEGEASLRVETRSSRPVVMETENLEGYGSRALLCLCQFDDLVRLSKGLQYQKILTKSECREVIHECGRRLRGLYAVGTGPESRLCRQITWLPDPGTTVNRVQSG